MKLVIEREKWLRGECGNMSYLLRARDGKMCCLGFYAKACGHNDDDILGIRSPARMPEWKGNEALDEMLAMSLNDSTITSDEHKETYITELFSEIGVECVFV